MVKLNALHNPLYQFVPDTARNESQGDHQRDCEQNHVLDAVQDTILGDGMFVGVFDDIGRLFLAVVNPPSFFH